MDYRFIILVNKKQVLSALSTVTPIFLVDLLSLPRSHYLSLGPFSGLVTLAENTGQS
jgi:hypothetical protein